MEDIGTWRSPSGELGTESMYGAIVLQPRLSSMQNLIQTISALWILPLRNAESAAVVMEHNSVSQSDSLHNSF